MANPLKGAVTAMSGAIGAQIVSLAAVPVITRLYPPELYGEFAIFSAIVGVLLPIAALRLNAAVLVPRMSASASRIRMLGYLAAAGVAALVIGLPLLWFGVWVVVFDGGSLDQTTLLAAAGAVLLLGWQQVESGWAARHGRWVRIAAARTLETGMDKAMAIVLGLAGMASGTSLIASRLLGVASSWLLLYIRGPRVQRASRSHLKRNAGTLRRYKQYITSSSIGLLIDGAGRHAPFLVFAALLPAEEAGYLSMAIMVSSIPLLLMGDALSQVFLRQAARTTSRAEAQELVKLVSGAIWWVFLPVILVLIASGPPILTAILGEKWGQAGTYAAVLCMAGPVALSHRVIGGLFELLGVVRIRLRLDISLAVVKVVGVFVVLINGRSGIEAVVLVAAANALIYGAGLLIVVSRWCGIPYVDPKTLLGVVPLAVVAAIVMTVDLSVAASIAWWTFGLVVYLGLLWPSYRGAAMDRRELNP